MTLEVSDSYLELVLLLDRTKELKPGHQELTRQRDLMVRIKPSKASSYCRLLKFLMRVNYRTSMLIVCCRMNICNMHKIRDQLSKESSIGSCDIMYERRIT